MIGERSVGVANRRALAGRLVRGSRPQHPSTPPIRFIESRAGVPVPALLIGGRERLLHSRYDPDRDAARALERRFGTLDRVRGYLVLVGLGGGAMLRIARSLDVSRILVIEPLISLVDQVLDIVPLAPVLGDSRITILAGYTGPEVEAFVTGDWLPVLHGDAQVLPLAAEADVVAAVAESLHAVERALDRVAGDTATQARFGRRWMDNMMANLPRLCSSMATDGRDDLGARLPAGSGAVLVGAGPSLDRALEETPLPADVPVVCCDAALPALVGRGIEPTVVVSVDCQHYSYLHVMGPIPSRSLLVADLASPPGLFGRFAQSVIGTGGHPFGRQVGLELGRIAGGPAPINLDTSGGNVTHTAVALLSDLEVTPIIAYGIDFAFVDGSPYARGTFMHEAATTRASRVNPAMSALGSRVLGADTVRIPRADGSEATTTTLMAGYASQLAELIAARDTNVVTVATGAGLLPSREPEPRGEQRRPHRAEAEAREQPYRTDGAGHTVSRRPVAAIETARKLLSRYRAAVAELPDPSDPIGAWLDGLSADQRGVVETLLPMACWAWRRRRDNATATMRRARNLTLDLADRRSAPP